MCVSLKKEEQVGNDLVSECVRGLNISCVYIYTGKKIPRKERDYGKKKRIL